MESQRHKKYTNMMGTQQPPAGLSNPDGSATMTSDPSASTSDPQGLGFPLRGILSSPRPNTVLQELDTMEVKEDPDFPPEFRANADPAQKSPRTNMLFSQLTSQVTNNIKPEPMSPRRPNVAGNNSIQVIDPEPLPGPSNADPGAQNLATQNPFHVDTSIISSVPMLQQASELQDLGLTVFDQEQFEQSVMAQVDQKIAAQEQVRINKQLEKQQKTIQEDLRLAKDELAKLEKVLQMFQPQQGNKDVARRLVAVKQQKELKLKQIKKIKAKLKSISLKLTGEVIDLDAEDDVPADGAAALSHALGGGTETEAERMVRLGEMTPFGTIMGFEDPVLSAHKPKKPKEPPKPRTLTSEGSDFNKYIQDQVQKHMQKKKMVIKKKKSSSPTDSVKPKETVEEPSEKLKRKSGEKSSSKSSPSKKLKKTSSAISLSDSNSRSSSNSDKSLVAQKLEIGKSGNMFDLKDKHVYRKKEADMSNVRSRRPRAAGFDHEFADDGVIDLGEVGDEDPDEDLTERRDDDDYRPEIISDEDGDEEYEKEDTEDLEELSDGNTWVSVKDEKKTKQKSGKRVKKKKISHSPRGDRDDGSLEAYEKRLQLLAKEKLRERQEKMAKGEDPESESDGSDMEFDRGYKVPGRIWNKLYRYQKTGVRWLWELHCQQSGGIVGDEMGLGKTIQIIAFLAGIKYSKLRDKGENAKYRGLGPVIIITPATVMHQWVKEFHRWWPEMRVAILHSSGSFTSSEDHLVYNIAKTCGVLITAYSTVVLRQDLLHRHGWHYVILDEGHKIRNPDAQVTLACKMFRTCHRIILSGSPIQNHLKELWSLFDFVFPGKLGTLPDFMQHFSVPIVQGGYSNATDVQVQTSYKCACVLRDTINPYLLRRMKADVQNNIQLPNKSEQVLFCRLTEHQRDVYKEYLESRECKEILDRNFMVFPGLITLRKVCNHPDISTGGPKLFDPVLAASGDPELEYGHWRRAGKMLVVESLLKIWRKQSHRVLLFTQSRMMLDILESFVKSQGYTYMKMDGTTPIGSRQTLIQRYNEDPSIYVFLLTTRVGGLGVNLTGADRIIIYDPDWNPSTDLQARERAWRIGQTREVTIYRLLTTGTIEEKIYHRQIFKQFLTNRVLKDPKQRRFFKSNDLYDLFTLGEDDLKTTTETSAIFAGTQSDVNVKVRHRKRSSKSSKDSGKVNRFDVLREKQKSEGIEVVDDVDGGEDSKKVEEERKAKLREMAKRLSQKFGANEPEKGESSNGISPESSQDPSTLDESQQEKVTEKSEKAKKKKKDKKKKKKKRKDAELDGETIANLDKHGTYHKQDEEEDDHKTGDAYVLEKLFKKTGVHSALEHDKIMMASSPDYALVEAEANRVAREAAKALRISRARCQRAETGIPTWTGHSGGATNGVQPAKSRFGKKKNPNLAPATSTVTSDSGKVETKGTESPKPATPKAKPTSLFDGSLAGNMKTPGVSGTGSAEANIMSSSELITRMKARNIYRDKPTDVNDDSAGYTDILEPETMELMTDLRNMVAFGCRVDGQATTQELLDQFAPKLPAGESAKFKAMLENLCEFGRRDGIGVWRLKQEFR